MADRASINMTAGLNLTPPLNPAVLMTRWREHAGNANANAAALQTFDSANATPGRSVYTMK